MSQGAAEQRAWRDGGFWVGLLLTLGMLIAIPLRMVLPQLPLDDRFMGNQGCYMPRYACVMVAAVAVEVVAAVLLLGLGLGLQFSSSLLVKRAGGGVLAGLGAVLLVLAGSCFGPVAARI